MCSEESWERAASLADDAAALEEAAGGSLVPIEGD